MIQTANVYKIHYPMVSVNGMRKLSQMIMIFSNTRRRRPTIICSQDGHVRVFPRDGSHADDGEKRLTSGRRSAARKARTADEIERFARECASN